MSLVGIIATSVLAALALFALFAGIGILIWLALRIRKENTQVSIETKALLTDSRAAVESAKGTFTSIRNEVKTITEGQQKAADSALIAHQKALTATLDTFRLDINAAIGKINAEALQTVAVRLTQVCVRAEKAIGVFQQLILDTEKSPHFDGGPEDTAPENAPFGGPPSSYSLSQTAKLDQEADMQTEAERFTESPAEV